MAALHNTTNQQLAFNIYFCQLKQIKLYFHKLKKFPKGQRYSLCNEVIYYVILTPAASGIIHLPPFSISVEQLN